MKTLTKKAFSIAEIIVTNAVVLTLGSVSFVTMESYVDGAKNVKVSHDLSNMLTKIEITTLSGKQTHSGLVVKNDKITAQNSLPGTSTINAWQTINSWSARYEVWNINFINLWEKKENFQDVELRDYIFAYVRTQNFVKTEIAGSVTDRDWNSASLVKWTYYPVTPSDTKWLITSAWESNFEIVENWKTQELY